MTVRTDVISEQIRQLVSTALHFELRDPGLKGVTITRVKVSPDLQFADIRFSMLEIDANPGPVLSAFGRAKGALKRYVSKNLSLRKVPELRFHLDEDVVAEQRIAEVLDNLNQNQVSGD